MQTEKAVNLVWRYIWLFPAALAALLGIIHIGHYGWTDPDEIIHSVVALNLSKHFFLPTLNEWGIGSDDPICPWGWTKIWLHKPILPLWFSAIFIKMLGSTPFAFRLPALFLHILNIILIYFLGRNLFDRRVGVIAALMAASFPYAIFLLYGGQFSDIYDLELIFWITLSLFLLDRAVKSQSWKLFFVFGVATALAYLTKWELGLMPLGVCILIFLFQFLNIRFKKPFVRDGILPAITSTNLILAFITAFAFAAPWLIYIFYKFPEVYMREHAMVYAHLIGDVEGWAKPWHYHIWNYMQFHYGQLYSRIIYISAFVSIFVSFSKRSFSDLFLLMALTAAFLPLSMAVSKVPSAGYIISSVIFIAVARFFVLIYDTYPRFRVILGAIVLAVLLEPLDRTLNLAVRREYRPVPIYRFSNVVNSDKQFENACFIFDSNIKTPKDNLYIIDHLQFMFFSGRCAVLLRKDTSLPELAGQIKSSGMRPFIVSSLDRYTQGPQNSGLNLILKWVDDLSIYRVFEIEGLIVSESKKSMT